jgi:hypothetical protein
VQWRHAIAVASASIFRRRKCDRQLALLGRLAEVGLEIAIALEAQAKGGDQVVQGDVAMAYNRVARAVRQTVMLQSRLIETLQDRQVADAGRRAAAQSRAARIVRGVIGDDRSGDAERLESLRTEAAERLREEDFGDLLSKPFAEAVADIVRDLGLKPDWLALASACFDAEAALAGGAASRADDDFDAFPAPFGWLEPDPPPDAGGSSTGEISWRERRLGRWAKRAPP